MVSLSHTLSLALVTEPVQLGAIHCSLFCYIPPSTIYYCLRVGFTIDSSINPTTGMHE